jgi:hypothetical protein
LLQEVFDSDEYESAPVMSRKAAKLHAALQKGTWLLKITAHIKEKDRAIK